MAGKSDTDLRGWGSRRDAVPTDTSLAHILLAVSVVSVKGTRGLTRDVPRERCHEEENDRGGGHNHNITAAKPSPRSKAIGLKTRHETHEDGAEVPRHRIRYRHKHNLSL